MNHRTGFEYASMRKFQEVERDTRIPLPCVLRDLAQKGVSFSVSHNRLRYRAARGALGPTEEFTISSRANEIIAYLGACEAAVRPVITPSAAGAAIPSLTQEAAWNTFRNAGAERMTNHLSLVVPYEGVDDLEARVAITAVVERHEVLRYKFCRKGDTLEVRTNDVHDLQIEVVALSKAASSRPGIIEELTAALASSSLAINGDWLTSAKILITGNRQGQVVMLVHHIVCDAASLVILRRELLAVFKLMGSGSRVTLPNATVRFSDYALWERAWFRGDTAKKLSKHWSGWVHSLPGLRNPNDGTQLEWTPGHRTHYDFVFQTDISEELRRLSVRLRKTTFLILICLYAMVLAKWARRRRFGILSVADARAFPESQRFGSTVGFFAHLDPVEAVVASDDSLRTVADAMSATYASARRLRFPVNDAQPGLTEKEFHHRIGAKFNYFCPSRISGVAFSSDRVLEKCRWPVTPTRVLEEEEIGIPIVPIHLRILHTELNIACRFEFNESVLAIPHQEAVVGAFINSVMHSVAETGRG